MTEAWHKFCPKWVSISKRPYPPPVKCACLLTEESGRPGIGITKAKGWVRRKSHTDMTKPFEYRTDDEERGGPPAGGAAEDQTAAGAPPPFSPPSPSVMLSIRDAGVCCFCS